MSDAERKGNIVLAGFMGTGKSTVGRLVADHLRWRFVDTDDEIVQRFGMSIQDIFLHHGEGGFRRYESIVVQSVAARQRQVIATGGGMLLDENNRRLLDATGIIVCLDAQPDVIEQRLGDGSGRPLARDWRNLYETRRPVYAALAHHVHTGDLTPETVAEEVIALWQKYG